MPKFHREIYKALEDDKIKKLAIIAPRNHSKAQSLKSKVLTPGGWKTIGQLRIGDMVIGADGKPTRVIALHPISKMKLYRVTTRDGRSTLCNEDHLWTVYNHDISSGIETKPLKDIMKNYKRRRCSSQAQKYYDEYHYFLPLPEPIQFPHKDLPIDPYTLGYWLGDGHTASGRVTTADPEVLTYMPFEISKNKAKYVYGILGLRKLLRKNNLLYNKHIPDEYFIASVEQREALLQGLMDSDGNVSSDGIQAVFANTNKRLIDGVVELVRSLGGTANVIDTVNRYEKDGKEFFSWKVIIKLPPNIQPFKLKRKRDKWNERHEFKGKVGITNIEYIGEDYARCITVENDDGLYITDDYMVTHNSTLVSLVYVLHRILFGLEKFVVITSESYAQSVLFLDAIKKELEENPKIKYFFGNLISDKWAEGDIETATGIKIIAKGAGQRFRGLKFRESRPTLIIMDDVESELNTETEQQRAKLFRWINGSVLPALADDGKIVFVGTIVHHDSYLNNLHIIGERTGWKVLYYQALDEKGEPIWPERFTKKFFEQKRLEYASQGLLDMYYMEYMNIAQAPEGRPFSDSMIQYFSGGLDFEGDQWYLRLEKDYIPVTITIGIDLALGKQGGDYTAILELATDPKGNHYVVNYTNNHMKPIEVIDRIFYLHKRYKGKVLFVIETVAFQEVLVHFMKQKMQETGTYVRYREINPRTAKSERLLSLQPTFAAGKMYLRRSMVELITQLLQYPKSKNDDLLDALYNAVQFAPKPTGFKKIKRKIKEIKQRYSWTVL